jgi:hypothetical protein
MPVRDLIRRLVCAVVGHVPGEREKILGMWMQRCRRCGRVIT